jgi:hypothetical protein
MIAPADEHPISVRDWRRNRRCGTRPDVRLHLKQRRKRGHRRRSALRRLWREVIASLDDPRSVP